LEHLSDVEKNEFTSDEFKGLYSNNIRPAPAEWITYNLCMLFHCLPSELANEDYNEVMAIVTMHSTASEVDKMRAEWKKKNLSAYLGIALELEKLKKEE